MSITLYIDGQLPASNQASTINYSTNHLTHDFIIGEWPGDTVTETPCAPRFVGDIDEVQFYGVALDDKDVARLYNDGDGLSCQSVW